MQYENPDLPEGVNNSDARPLANFVRLAAAAAALVAVLAGALLLLADRLTPLVPFRYETAVAGRFFPVAGSEGVIEPYLRQLAGRLAAAQGLPEGVTVQVHYNEAAALNAFATLGGHVVLFQGLLEAVPDENALAMVMAHEIAHVRHRHPITAAGRGAALGFALMVLGVDSGGGAVESALSHGGTLAILSFSRSQEEQADATALETLQRVYGHVGGADRFFRTMVSRAGSREPPRLLASHPLTTQRIEALGALAASRGWKADGEPTPIPAAVQAEIERRKQARG
jgi:predicted Zn-dependent protease